MYFYEGKRGGQRLKKEPATIAARFFAFTLSVSIMGEINH